MLKLVFAQPGLPRQHALIMTLTKGNLMGEWATKLNKELKGGLTKALQASYFTGALGETLTLQAPSEMALSQIILVGIGDGLASNPVLYEKAGGAAFAALSKKEKEVTVCFDPYKGLKCDETLAAAHFAIGMQLRSYRFDKYRTKQRPEERSGLTQVLLSCSKTSDVKRHYARLEKIVEGVYFTRDLVSEPGNVIYPKTLADACLKLQALGVKVTVLNEAALTKLKMGALLGVAQGSHNSPYVVTLEWRGSPRTKDKRPIVLVGKGVTFDSGGLSLKPPGGMEDMKWDMAGAGAVIGALKAIAGRRARANVVGIVGLVENMPSGTAQRPGDIVTTMSGQTVEVLNTDAEGRLVLADVMTYVQKKYNPQMMIDIATLTGAIIVSLGHEYAGLFSNDDGLATKLTEAGADVSELLWRFPLSDAYDKDIDSPIADMKNIGSKGEAGSVTAAQFLQRFVNKGVAWAHLDIAGMAWGARDKPVTPKGATGYGVRLFDRFVEYLEDK